MHRRLAVPLAALTVLVVAPGAAHAKGLTGLAICGTNGCVDRSAAIRGDAALMEDLMSYGVTVADPGPAPYVKLEESMGDGGETYGQSTVTYYATLGIEGFDDGTFHRATPATRRSLARLSRGVVPFGMPAVKPKAQRAAQRSSAAPPASAAGGGDGVPFAVWVAGGVALVALAAAGAAAMLRRGGRPATG